MNKYNQEGVVIFFVRVSRHLIKNMDNIRKRRKGEVVEEVVEEMVDWKKATEIK